MFENLQRPTVYRASNATEIRAIAPPSGQLPEVFVLEAGRPLAVLAWSPACLLDDSPADGVFLPSDLSSSEPGRWIFSRFVSCGVGW